jgi:hypothetical protein
VWSFFTTSADLYSHASYFSPDISGVKSKAMRRTGYTERVGKKRDLAREPKWKKLLETTNEDGRISMNILYSCDIQPFLFGR